MAEPALLTVENLSVEFHARGKIVQAVRNVSWQVNGTVFRNVSGMADGTTAQIDN